MPLPFMRSCHHFLRRLFSMASRSTAFQLSEVPAEAVPVLSFCQSLGTFYQTAGGRMGRYRLRRIQLFKRRKGSRHEYLILEFVDEEGSEFYLCLERGPGDRLPCEGKRDTGSPLRPSAHSFFPESTGLGPYPSESSLPLESSPTSARKPEVGKKNTFSRFLSSSSSFSQSPPSSPSSSGGSSADSILSKPRADDVFSPQPLPGARDKNDELLISVSFVAPDASLPKSLPTHPRPGPYLHEVSVLASLIHQQSPAYSLATHNCFYFAGIVLKSLQELFVVAPADDVAESMPNFCGLSKETQPGSFSGVMVCDTGKLDTTQIKKEFPGALADFERPIELIQIQREAAVAHMRKLEAENIRLNNLVSNRGQAQ